MNAALVSWAAVICLAAGCGKKQSEPATKATNTTATGNPVTAPVDYLGAVGRAKRVSEKVADLAPVKQAIQMFQAAEDRYPKDLAELVKSGYLPAQPKAPTGMKFKYDAASGEVKLVEAPANR